MNELERAATAVRDRPPAAPTPLASIERRAVTLRRRRRLLEAGAIALVVLVLGTAGVALSAARDDGDRQGVFVGEGPVKVPTVTMATYRLGSPIDDATAQALELKIEARFGYLGLAIPQVQIDGTEVTVTTAPAEDINDITFLVTRSGGFELHPVLGEAPEADCASPGGAGDGGAMGTSALTGPPRCLSVGPAVPLPPDPSTGGGSGESADGTYELDVDLTPTASLALVDTLATCPEQACLPETIAVATGGGIVHPEAQVTPNPSDSGATVRIVMLGLSDVPTAKRWASVLLHPLPDGVELTRVLTDPTATIDGSTTTIDPSASSSTVVGQTEASGSASGPPAIDRSFPPPAEDGKTVFVFHPQPQNGTSLDDATAVEAASVFDARLRALGYDTGGRAWLDPSGSGRIGFLVPTPGNIASRELAEDLAIQAEFGAGFATPPDYAAAGLPIFHARGSDVRGATIDASDPTVVHVRVASTLVPVAEQLLACPDSANCILPEVSFPITGRTAEAVLAGSSGDTLFLKFPDPMRARIFLVVLQRPLPNELLSTGNAG